MITRRYRHSLLSKPYQPKPYQRCTRELYKLHRVYRHKLAALCLLTLLTLLASGCSNSPYSDDYLGQSPAFDLYEFFEGEVTAWAIVQNRRGEVVQRFRADILGSISPQEPAYELSLDRITDTITDKIADTTTEANETSQASDASQRHAGRLLTLDETFHYTLGDGVKRRVWRIQSNGNGQYIGEADDIIGQASGQLYGNALNWRYQMDLSIASGTYRVSFDDWMWMIDADTMMNRAYIKKFGLVMAEVTLLMKKTRP